MTYLFYFHRGWKPEWGGNIAFDKNTHWQMFIPQAGSLVLFDVRDNENRHMVTEVVRDRTRYAITGWLV
jgi:Rps23 Pro-64 3,4-dihydroxylase Tpa1-like proline 4-hydroxylase